MKLAEIKSKARKHAPTIAAVTATVTTAIAAGLAVYYRNQLVRLAAGESDPWPMIKVSSQALKDVENGKTLMYRQRKLSPTHLLVQSTTSDKFSDEADARFFGENEQEFKEYLDEVIDRHRKADG